MKRGAIAFLLILFAGMIWSYFQMEQAFQTDVTAALEKPSPAAWLGRDSLGRDLLMRIFHGAQVSVGLGIISSLAAMVVGILIGAFSALSPKVIDQSCMRIVEVLMSLPSLMLMAVLAMIFRTQMIDGNFALIFWVLVFGSWMPMARITRNLILQERQKEYVEAAVAIGAGPSRIFFRHLLPNLVSPILVYWSLQVPPAILAEGMLSFLGFGVQSPGVSWGALLQEGWKTLANYPHLLFGPSAFLFFTVLSINVLLEDFRQSMDPKLKWEKFS